MYQSIRHLTAAIMDFASEEGIMMFNATFINISGISWWSVLLVEETGAPRENHRPFGSHWQILSHNAVSSTPHNWAEFKLTTYDWHQKKTGSFFKEHAYIMPVKYPSSFWPDEWKVTVKCYRWWADRWNRDGTIIEIKRSHGHWPNELITN